MQPLPHGYSNDSRTDGRIVMKRHLGPAAAQRRETERSVLTRLPAGLAAPRLLAGPEEVLVMAHLPGVHAQELVDAGHAGEVLRACGGMLHRLQQTDVREIFADDHSGGRVLVHGDFGPNNMLLDPATFAVTGLVDWEWAHPGDPIEDLAWCEWIVRMHHPAAVGALAQLFAAYGSRPAWAARRTAMLDRCEQLVALMREDPDAAAREQVWRDRAAITRSWTA